MPEHLLVTARAAGPSRTEEMWGRQWQVFPAVLVREQVLKNNLGRTFLPRDEIDASADSWNAIPVVIRHPLKRGQPVSARDPEVLNTRGAGFLFRTRAENGELKADVWVDMDRARDMPETGDVLNRVTSGEVGELSTGFATNVEKAPGEFGGEKYDLVLRNIRPDHLALLPDEVGACSVKDGCGLGVNHAGECECGGAGNESAASPEETASQAWWKRMFAAAVAEFRGETEPEAASEEPAEGDHKEEGTMNRDQMIAQLAEAGTDREALAALSDDQLRVLCAAGDGASGKGDARNSGDSEAWRIAREYREKYERLQAETESAVENQEKERARLLDDVLYARNRPWTDEEVRAMDIHDLRKVHQALVRPQADYSGRGGPRAGNAASFDFVKPILDGHRGESVLDSEEVA